MPINDLTNQEEIIEKTSTEIQPTNNQPPIYIRTLNIFAVPFKKRYEKHYRASKKHLIIDIFLAVAIIFLIIANIHLLTQKFPLDGITIQFHRPAQTNLAINNNNQNIAEQIPNSELYLSAQALYFTAEGEQLGLGPWPPKTNETSQIRIIINLKSTLHALTNVNLIINPSEKTAWLNNSAVNLGQALKFNKSNNQITWHLDHLSLNESATLSFALSVNPTPVDLGKKILLIKNITASGVDVVTKNNITANQNSLLSPAVQ